MDDSTYTIVALVGVVVLFVSGVTLIVIGLRGRTDRLPEGAGDILDAIDAGLLVPTDDDASAGTVDLRPAGDPRAHGADAPAPEARSAPEGPSEQEDDTVTRLFFSREPELERF